MRRRQDQLPPGRHGLTREQVRSDQHARVMRAVIDVTSISGYGAMNVEHLVATSGISRRTFYDMFPDKQAAFIACYREIVAELTEVIRTAYEAQDDPIVGTLACLSAIAKFIEADPLRSETLLVEVQAAGSEAVGLRSDNMARLSTALAAAMATWPTAPKATPLTPEIAVGAMHGILYKHVSRGEIGGLVAQVDEAGRALVTSLLGPQPERPPLAQD